MKDLYLVEKKEVIKVEMWAVMMVMIKVESKALYLAAMKAA
jgi:hypothetical protein